MTGKLKCQIIILPSPFLCTLIPLLRVFRGLVLANISKEDQAFKRNDPSRLSTGPRSAMILSDDQPRNADGTPRTINQPAIEARQLQRINKICHYMLLEDERIAGALVVSLVDVSNIIYKNLSTVYFLTSTLDFCF